VTNSITLPTLFSQAFRPWNEIFLFVFGTFLGSFFNVCIHRLPRNLSIVFPGSACASCKTPIRWYDNIPIFSYLILGGRCRPCGERYSPRYLLVELLTGFLFLAVWEKFGWSNPWLAVALLVFVSGSLIATFVDLEHYLIPDGITIGGIFVGLGLSLAVESLQASMAGHPISLGLGSRLSASVEGILIGSGIILWIAILGEAIFQREAMGFGDVKLMGAIGAFLGWEATVFALGVAALTGVLAGGALWFWRKRQVRKQQQAPNWDDSEVLYQIFGGEENSSIPFGPFLILGALAWVFDPPATWHHWLSIHIHFFHGWISYPDLNWHQMTGGTMGQVYCWPEPYPCSPLFP
jgi:leader peptidase (prepilin peptidase)/N-methyltransferase